MITHKELSRGFLLRYIKGASTDVIASDFNVSSRIVNRWLRYYADKYCLNNISDLRGFDYSIYLW